MVRFRKTREATLTGPWKTRCAEIVWEGDANGGGPE